MTKVVVAALATVLIWAPGPAIQWGAGPTPTLPSSLPTPQPITPAPGTVQTTVTITNGPRGDVHDGQLIQGRDGAFYLIGTRYSAPGCTFSLGSATSQWCGFEALKSTDLQSWTDLGPLFDPAPWQARCAAPNYGCFRPHELYNAADDRWVLWANIDDTPTQPTDPGVQAWTGPTPFGPFTDAGRPHLSSAGPGPAHYGDLSLYRDDTGTGYVTYTVIGSDGGHDLAIERLDSHYLTGTGAAVHLPRSSFNMVEAPSLFKQGGTYELLYSDPICAYCSSTGTGWATASDLLGPWTKRGDLSSTSCKGQPSAVTTLSNGTQLYQSDQWLGTPNESAALQHWEPLIFDSNQNIQPLTCAAQFTLSVAT